jgi:Zn-dependent peptidase ImmA (M78 family)
MAARSTAQREPVAAARLARQELGAGLEAPLVDVLKLIEGPGNVPVTIAELPTGLSGALLVERQKPFILVNGRDYPGRQRFTLAHEFGHWRLGHGEVVDGPDSFKADQTNPAEVDANYFAAEFLAPAAAITAWMEARSEPEVELSLVVHLALDFGISAEVARIRLEATRFLANPRRRSELKTAIRGGEHRALMFRLGLTELQDTIAEAQDELPRLPARLRTGAIAAYESGMLDVERLAGLLRKDPDDTGRELAEFGIRPAVALDDEPDY